MSALMLAAIKASAFPTMPIVWDDVDDQPPHADPAAPWARFLIRHSKGRQASLSGAQATKRWIRGGLLVVQLFAPGGDGQRVGDELVSIILDAFEGGTTTGGVLFRNSRINEVGQSGGWHQVNIIVEFEYDEIK